MGRRPAEGESADLRPAYRPSMPSLPPESIAVIIHKVAVETIPACALTCGTFLPFAREQPYTKIWTTFLRETGETLGGPWEALSSERHEVAKS